MHYYYITLPLNIKFSYSATFKSWSRASICICVMRAVWSCATCSCKSDMGAFWCVAAELYSCGGGKSWCAGVTVAAECATGKGSGSLAARGVDNAWRRSCAAAEVASRSARSSARPAACARSNLSMSSRRFTFAISSASTSPSSFSPSAPPEVLSTCRSCCPLHQSCVCTFTSLATWTPLPYHDKHAQKHTLPCVPHNTNTTMCTH